MPKNKNALIRYIAIDRCLRNYHRQWTIDDLICACSEALSQKANITTGVSLRTVQNDLKMMRSSDLGYNAPIEVYGRIYYRYSDPNYSIVVTSNDCKLLSQAIAILSQIEGCEAAIEMLNLLRDHLEAINND